DRRPRRSRGCKPVAHHSPRRRVAIARFRLNPLGHRVVSAASGCHRAPALDHQTAFAAFSRRTQCSNRLLAYKPQAVAERIVVALGNVRGRVAIDGVDSLLEQLFTASKVSSHYQAPIQSALTRDEGTGSGSGRSLGPPHVLSHLGAWLPVGVDNIERDAVADGQAIG